MKSYKDTKAVSGKEACDLAIFQNRYVNKQMCLLVQISRNSTIAEFKQTIGNCFICFDGTANLSIKYFRGCAIQIAIYFKTIFYDKKIV